MLLESAGLNLVLSPRYSLGLLSLDGFYLGHLLPGPQHLLLCFCFYAVVILGGARAAPSTGVSPFTHSWEGYPKTGWMLLVYPLFPIPFLGVGGGGGDPCPVPFCCPGPLLSAPPFPGCEIPSPGPFPSRWM